MSSTIFCTFDQQDLADLAMGQVRQVPGVNHVCYVAEQSDQDRNAARIPAYGYGLWGTVAADGMSTLPLPSAPASIKVICDKNARKQVESVLINLHAYRIVSTS